MDLSSAMTIAAAGMKAQSARLRVTAENLANAESTAAAPGGDPFRRKTDQLRRARATATAAWSWSTSRRYGVDRGDFELRYQPGHPAADADGYVKYPNVNPLIELMRHARGAALLRGQPQRAAARPVDDRAHARSAALTRPG